MMTGYIYNEKLSHRKIHGEDAYPYVNDNIVAIADGLGGRGPEEYKDKDGNIYTSAYIGANSVIKAIGSMSGDELDTNSIKSAILYELDEADKQYDKIPMGVTSSLFKKFPTTLALGYVNDNILKAFWCGDSRVYALSSEKGLIQISKDDLAEDLDPFKNIIESGQMSQYISLSSDFVINESIYEIGNANTIVFVASDGVFDSFESPMHFELFLLSKLQEADEFEVFISSIQNEIIKISGDDVSAGFIFCGTEVYEDWKESTRNRFEMVKEELEVIEVKNRLIVESERIIEENKCEIKKKCNEIMVKKAPEIAEKIVCENMTAEEREISNNFLGELKDKLGCLQKRKHTLVNLEKEFEKAFLDKIVIDYLNREQKKIGRWTNEFKFKELNNEKLYIHNKFRELINGLIETEHLIEEKNEELIEEFEKDKFIDNRIIKEIKIFLDDYIELISKGSISGRIARRKEKCDKAIATLCNSVIEENRTIFMSYIYDNMSIPFAISNNTQNCIDKFKITISELEEVDKKLFEIEEELSVSLSKINDYEKIKYFLKNEESEQIIKLIENINRNLERTKKYENDIITILDSMWSRYRINYEYYYKNNCIDDNLY